LKAVVPFGPVCDRHLVLLGYYSCIDQKYQQIFYTLCCIGRPAIALIQNSIDIALHCFLKPRVLGQANELKEEDRFKEADQRNMKCKPYQSIVPGLGGRKGSS
jgi:hypothetical protein